MLFYVLLDMRQCGAEVYTILLADATFSSHHAHCAVSFIGALYMNAISLDSLVADYSVFVSRVHEFERYEQPDSLIYYIFVEYPSPAHNESNSSGET